MYNANYEVCIMSLYRLVMNDWSSKKHARTLSTVALLVYGIPIVPAAIAENCPLPAPDSVTESNLAYRAGAYILDTLGHQPYPFGSFAIQVDGEGEGHLQAHATRNGRLPVMTKGVIISDWTERTSYFIKGKGWTQLSLEGAKNLWGEPRKHVVNDHPFYTFDAHSTWNGEENLYHLDLAFTKDGVIMGYRVRGIGIFNPQWVTDPAKTWVVEHVETNGGYE
jgi:hypothetical protein